MALPDIKDAGILAEFERWGWPWHGLIKGGMVGSTGKAVTQPGYGSAWLIDMGLPALDIAPGVVASEAAAGREWRNYALIPGGRVHDTALGANKYIHVDEAGVRWLVGMSFSYPELLDQKIRITFSVVQFGHFGDGVKTPVSTSIDVQCNYLTYSVYNYSYEGFETILEDVWTNGSRALVSFGRTRSTTPQIKDLFSVIEITISGEGGEDGSELVIDATEVMQDTELSQGVVTEYSFGPTINIPSPEGLVWDGSPFNWTAKWGATKLVRWTGGMNGDLDSIGNLVQITDQTYARFAYYNASGEAKAARLQKVKKTTYTYVSTTYGEGGSLVGDNLNCDGSSSGPTIILHDTGLVTSTTTVQQHNEFGIKLLENDTVIDSLILSQTVTGTQYWAMVSNGYPVSGYTVCDEVEFPPGTWGTTDGVLYDRDLLDISFGTPSWSGSLVGALPLPAAPDVRTLWYLDDEMEPTEPLNVDDLLIAWRVLDNHKTSATATVADGVTLGIQRIDAKAAAFFMPGAPRTWGNVLTPLGVKTATGTGADLYFAWQRKTGDFSFDTVPICYV